MTMYIKLDTKELCHEGDIRIEYPEIPEDQTGATFPCPDAYAPVVVEPYPECVNKEVADRNAPQLINGTWTVTWTKRALTAAEIDRDAQIVARVKEQISPKP